MDEGFGFGENIYKIKGRNPGVPAHNPPTWRIDRIKALHTSTRLFNPASRA
jgi:hypothetical protein